MWRFEQSGTFGEIAFVLSRGMHRQAPCLLGWLGEFWNTAENGYLSVCEVRSLEVAFPDFALNLTLRPDLVYMLAFPQHKQSLLCRLQ